MPSVFAMLTTSLWQGFEKFTPEVAKSSVFLLFLHPPLRGFNVGSVKTNAKFLLVDVAIVAFGEMKMGV